MAWWHLTWGCINACRGSENARGAVACRYLISERSLHHAHSAMIGMKAAKPATNPVMKPAPNSAMRKSLGAGFRFVNP
jgi:hypothetical protein